MTRTDSPRVIPVRQDIIDTSKLLTITSVPRHIRSRRKRWLELNPSYFESASADLELSDPLTYDRLIRRHQSAAEREAEGRKRGWASSLETSLLRGEAKLAKADPGNPKYGGALHTARRVSNAAQAQREGPEIDWTIQDSGFDDSTTIETAEDAKILNEAQRNSERPATDTKTRQRGREQWRELLAQRFVNGHDDNFEYSRVDEDESLDESSGQTAQDQWFEDEEVQFEGSPHGETGVQDF